MVSIAARGAGLLALAGLFVPSKTPWRVALQTLAARELGLSHHGNDSLGMEIIAQGGQSVFVRVKIIRFNSHLCSVPGHSCRRWASSSLRVTTATESRDRNRPRRRELGLGEAVSCHGIAGFGDDSELAFSFAAVASFHTAC